jgi:hypothetical protein
MTRPGAHFEVVESRWSSLVGLDAVRIRVLDGQGAGEVGWVRSEYCAVGVDRPDWKPRIGLESPDPEIREMARKQAAYERELAWQQAAHRAR